MPHLKFTHSLQLQYRKSPNRFTWQLVRLLVAALLSVCTLSTAQSAITDKRPALGLIAQDGQLLRNGRPFRAMGINYFPCLTDYLQNASKTEFVSGFRILKQRYQIPFVRFMAGPYAHTGWKLYLDQPEEYFRRFDHFIETAEKEGIGLIPSLFWYVATLPDLCDEPLSALGDSQSQCRMLMRRYIKDVVGRYVDSPAIWGWELGNEWMLYADLPQYNHLPRPKIGSKQARTAADKLTRPMLLDAYRDFHQTVRRYDSQRILMTGDSIARPSAWHNRHQDKWGQDSQEQWTQTFRGDTPPEYSTVSFHLYENAEKAYFKQKDLSLEQLVQTAVAIARKDKKIVWCGELGMPGNDDKARQFFFRMMDAVGKSRIDISAIWSFKLQGTAQKEWDISPTNERAYMLEAVQKFNKRYALGDWK